jgi:hypothetical protein
MILAAQGIKIWGAIDFLGTFAGRKAFAPILGGASCKCSLKPNLWHLKKKSFQA